MKIAVQYVNDANGDTQAIQLSLSEWERVVRKIRKYEQSLKLRTDLSDAFAQVSELKRSRRKKQTLSEFLDEV